ncbi:Glycerate dehydrogenase [Jeotgalicoccus saudimassiliensis]|uniref:Glycerate dehydrogenase n=1 Tax=Jeotgalicoccus saudimassiliensis TaxID=1461582 RepID=A0A078M704_9STAP|nr:NAD(P)-dependent oxidoreductase [Jeotgalicoccus saudimassiliensis]CEA00481.1 Glycerate dehydrogenase [Jeotgalicoccus saudimassiliensis]
MKVLITGALSLENDDYIKIEKEGFEIIFLQFENQELHFDPSSIDIIICNNLFQYHNLNKFKNLKMIQLTSAGYDRVPLKEIKNRNIKIYNAKNVYSIPIAEWVILKILEIYKDTYSFFEKQRNHQWVKNRNLLTLQNKNVALVGYGAIGKEIAKRLKPFGVNILAVNTIKKQLDNNIEAFGVNQLESVLKVSDIVIILLPKNSQTSNLIDKNLLKVMKKNSILINVSRGEVVNQEDLIDVLHQGKFLGVALDVFKTEPLPKESELWDMKRLYITPHNSFVSELNNQELLKLINSNLLNFRNEIIKED